MTWQDQGRQYHMWFGHGTAGSKEKPSKAGSDPMFEPGNISQRIDAVAHGAMMHLPRKEWHRPALFFDRQRLERLRTAMTTWLGARALSDAAFGARLLDPLTSDATVGALRAAAKGAQAAQSREDLKGASGQLAAGMQGVGLDKWPGFLRDAAGRAEAHQPNDGRIVLAQAVTNTKDHLEQRQGGASYYNLPGNKMANGQLFDAAAMNAAMLRVPLGTKVKVISADDPSRSIEVTVTDRGPYAPGRVIDLTPTAFRALFGTTNRGVAPVTVIVPGQLTK